MERVEGRLTVEMVAAVAGQMEFPLLLEVSVVLDSTGVRGLLVVQILHTEVAVVEAWDQQALRETMGRQSVALASRTLDRSTRVAVVVARIRDRVRRVDLALVEQVVTPIRPELRAQLLLVRAAVAAVLARVVMLVVVVMVLTALW